MKFVSSQLSYFLTRGETRQNTRALVKYVLLLTAVMILHSILFHVIMVHVEGQEHSWFSGFYWTLTVMSTLGFGDITFESDIGRIFSSIVLLTGIVLLLVLLPFMFIRFFFAPWLEAQIRFRAPREVSAGTRDHIIICRCDEIGLSLIEKLKFHSIPYVVLEPDPQKALALLADGVQVLLGEVDSTRTFQRALLSEAGMVIANVEDAVNTNITLTTKELAPDVPVTAIAERETSIDILELSGADHILPLKQMLGEQLAGRINAGHVCANIIGHFHGLSIAEFPVHGTPLIGKTIVESQIRKATGVSILAVWESGEFLPAKPDHVLTENSVPIIFGTEEQIEALEALFIIYYWNENPTLVIGGGRVGRACSAAIKRRGVPVHLLELNPALLNELESYADKVIIGDAADRKVIMDAGLAEAPSVVLTAHDDATNIYLAIYCRRLSPTIRIVSRINHERNIAAVLRAGADFVLSYTSLGASAIHSLIEHSELIVLGENINIFEIPVPKSLNGKTLGNSEIGAQTGMTVMAVSNDDQISTRLSPEFELKKDAGLLVVGTDDQLAEFKRIFGT